MAIRYTPHDRDLSSSFLLKIRSPEGVESPVMFQFPPRVVNDSRDGDWKEEPVGPNAPDHIAVYKSGTPRRLTIEWTYIVDGSKFPATRIHDEVRKLRGYFSNTLVEGGGTFDSLIVMFWAWNIGGKAPMSFRLKSSNIKHGQTLVGSGKDAFPLRTDVAVELKTWAKVGEAQIAPGQLDISKNTDWY